jgi:hypothetical protein
MGCRHSHPEAILQNGRGMYDLPLVNITNFPPKLHQVLLRLLSTLPSAESLAPVATTPFALSTGTRAKLSPRDSATESLPRACAFRTIMASLCRCQVHQLFNTRVLKSVFTTIYPMEIYVYISIFVCVVGSFSCIRIPSLPQLTVAYSSGPFKTRGNPNRQHPPMCLAHRNRRFPFPACCSRNRMLLSCHCHPFQRVRSRRKSNGRCCIACWGVNRTSQRHSSRSSSSSNNSHFTPTCC